MTVQEQRSGAVAVLTIDRPEVRNALDQRTLLDLHARLLACGEDRTVRAVVLTATGDRAFSAGLDLKDLVRNGVPDASRSPVNLLRDGYAKPVVGAVNGAAVGGGFELALACDLLVAAEHAVFALPEVSRGIVASEGGTDLPLRLPVAVALELGLTGEPLTAADALRLGLVNRVTAGADVLPAALALAERIACHSPAAVAATKRLMRRASCPDPAVLRAENLRATAELLNGPDAAEGAAAFLEKRPPRWTDPA
ncbi:enoyl-CoA hydratase/isomerase family protein [Lentzea sp. E54]|uniref:enoyl-CoA hydratase/isomerase family protein n=1 Tax=Lentzea xerophila TaxID=3435883 RepID=UPI003DA49727